MIAAGQQYAGARSPRIMIAEVTPEAEGGLPVPCVVLHHAGLVSGRHGTKPIGVEVKTASLFWL
jgi:hypothetical protein